MFGRSEGGIYALLLASGLAGPAPRVRAVGLLEPVPIRMLDLLEQGPIPIPPVTGAAQQGQMTAAQARSLQQALARAVASLRRTGTLPPGMPRELPGFVFPTPLLEFAQIDRYDPAAVAARLPAHTAVLLTCGNADAPVGCAQEDHLATRLLQASARLDYVHLDGVDHFLKEDIARVASTNNQSLPFSAQLRAELKSSWPATCERENDRGGTTGAPRRLRRMSASPNSPDRRRTRNRRRQSGPSLRAR